MIPGTVTYQGREFELTRGTVNFVNPYAIEPELDLESEHQIRDWTILLAIAGTPEQLRIDLSSTPAQEHGDIVSLLLTGKTTNELIKAEGGSTTSPAAMLAGIAAASLAEKVRTATGLDTLEVGYEGDSDSSLQDGISVTAGKELTESITVTYGVETRDGSVVQNTATHYKLSDTVTVSGFQATDGNYGGEIRYRLEFK